MKHHLSLSPEQRKRRKHLRIEGVLSNQPILGPQTVHFDIANGCNVRCTTCWHHSLHLDAGNVPTLDWKKRTMSFDSFRSIMDDLEQLGGLEQIILSGMGDPSLNRELPQMVRYAHNQGAGVTIITNLLAVDLPSILSSPGELNLLTSICGVTKSVWEDFHGGQFAGGFERLLGQLQVLRDANFLPKHVQVINSQNFHELPAMIRFADEWPAKRVNFKFASLTNGTEAVALSISQKRELLDRLIPRATAIAEFKNIATDLSAFESQVSLESNQTAPIDDVGCYMGTIYCRITVDLELLYCCNTEMSIGFLGTSNSFRQLWEGEVYHKMRQRIGEGQYLESCKQCGKYKQNLKWADRLTQLEARPKHIGGSQ